VQPRNSRRHKISGATLQQNRRAHFDHDADARGRCTCHPTVFHVTAAGRAGGWSQAAEHNLSLAIAIVLFVTYACMLGFELVTHKQLYTGNPQDGDEARNEARGWSLFKSLLC
jgi:Ca2+/H+ antiporter